jgi:UDP-N-acetylglucosamine enolpyruvyl transferase
MGANVPHGYLAIDDAWFALRFRLVDKMKRMTRKSAVTEKGKQRIEN